MGGCTWHVALGFAALHPLAALVAPVVLVHQHHIHADAVVRHGVEPREAEAEEWEHAPGEGTEAQTLSPPPLTPSARACRGGSSAL